MLPKPLSQSHHLDSASSEARRRVLEKYLRGEVGSELRPAAITPRTIETRTQLSFAQERLWFFDQLLPGSPVFNVPLAIRIATAVDLDILQQAVDQIVCRHEVLRTTFHAGDGEPTPVIAD